MGDLGTGASHEGLLHQSDASIIERFALEGCISGLAKVQSGLNSSMNDSAMKETLEVSRLANIGGTDAHRLGEVGQTKVSHGHGYERKSLALVCADW